MRVVNNIKKIERESGKKNGKENKIGEMKGEREKALT
jgi:hypothetical protein